MSDNPQFLRTDKAIRQALITLLKKKPFEKITVQDILDETPVTRSTFYKHYRDKYDVVEQMQEEFLATQNALSKELRSNPATTFLQKTLLDNREILNILLPIHTDNIDLRQHIATYLEEYYLEQSQNPDKKLQAKIFAQMMTQLRISEFPLENINFEYMCDTLISVLFMALCIPDDDELREQIKATSQKFKDFT